MRFTDVLPVSVAEVSGHGKLQLAVLMAVASQAGDHRSEAGQGRQFRAPKAFLAMRSVGIGGSSVQFRVRAPIWACVRIHRSRASAQASFIRSLRPLLLPDDKPRPVTMHRRTRRLSWVG